MEVGFWKDKKVVTGHKKISVNVSSVGKFLMNGHCRKLGLEDFVWWRQLLPTSWGPLDRQIFNGDEGGFVLVPGSTGRGEEGHTSLSQQTLGSGGLRREGRNGSKLV